MRRASPADVVSRSFPGVPTREQRPAKRVATTLGRRDWARQSIGLPCKLSQYLEERRQVASLVTQRPRNCKH